MYKNKPILSTRPDFCFIDVNNYLYNYHDVPFGEFVVDFYDLLHHIISTSRVPTHSLFFGIDGPGPHAKIPIQLKRRLSHAQSQNLQALHAVPTAPETNPLLSKMNCLEFTPGTRLLDQITDAIKFFCVSGMCQSGITPPSTLPPGALPLDVPQCVVNGADQTGEGEFKIFQFLREQVTDLQDFPSIIIASGDSDIVMFSLRAGYFFSNVHVMNSRGKKGRATVTMINKLRRTLLDEVLPPTNRASRECQQVIDDWVLLNLLRGSDLFPPVPGFKFEVTWQRYCRAKGKLRLWNQRTRSVDLRALSRVIYIETFKLPRATQQTRLVPNDVFHSVASYAGLKIKAVEDDDNISLYLNGTLFVQSPIQQKKKVWTLAILTVLAQPEGMVAHRLRSNLSPSSFELTWQTMINTTAATSSPEAPDSLDTPLRDIPVASQFDAMHWYLQGLSWNMEYLTGRCADYSYHYDRPHVPLFTPESLLRAAEYFENPNAMKLTAPVKTEHHRSALDPLSHSLLVLPRNVVSESYSHVPAVRALVDGTSPINDIIPPSNLQTIWEINNFQKSLPPLASCIDRVHEAVLPIIQQNPDIFSSPHSVTIANKTIKDEAVVKPKKAVPNLLTNIPNYIPPQYKWDPETNTNASIEITPIKS